MMPENLYIPTSSLNFNNIMSNESISPYSFYLRREFGYKRIEKVNPNNLNNRLVLYKEFPDFDVDNSELENYPMVIMVHLRSLKEDIIKEQNGVFYSEETIYLNPFNTKIIFRNNNEKKATIFKAEPSIEAKMVSIYKNAFTSIDNELSIPIFKWEKCPLDDSNNDISKYISEDRRINKLKGFLYAYLISSNKSVPQDIVVLKKNIRSLENTLSAIISNPESRATNIQEVQLNTIYKTINTSYQNIFISPILKEKSEKYNCDFLTILKQENILESWLRQNNLSKYQITPFYSPSKERDKALVLYIQNLEKQIINTDINGKSFKLNLTLLPIIQFNRIVSIPDQKEFLLKLFNGYLEEAYSSGDFIQSRYEFAKSGGKIFKDELLDKWEGSQSQIYINALLKNLNEFSAFDIKSINNIGLESFAAFCQKGEDDIDKLEDYLISNEIGDFRIAFSLWGIVFGFANMPKTLTNHLFLCDDVEHLALAYKQIYKQIHGVDLEGDFQQKINELKSIKMSHDLPEGSKQKETNNETIKAFESQEIRSKLKGCKLKSEQIDSIYDLYEDNKSIIDEKFFISIKKVSGIGGKAIEKIKEAFGYVDSSSLKSSIKNISLFEDVKPELGKMFYNDSNAWFFIEPLIPKSSQKKVKTEIDWIQNVHKDNGYRRQSGEWIPLNDHSNISVIKHLENNAKNRIDSILLEKIVAKLLAIYS
jgi:hypothetical protein